MEERDMEILLTALCKLLKVNTTPLDISVAVSDARKAVESHEQATNPFGLNQRR